MIDQYQVSTDKCSGITSDPNRADDEEYIVRLVGRVVAVSVETVKIVNRDIPLRVRLAGHWGVSRYALTGGCDTPLREVTWKAAHAARRPGTAHCGR